MKEKYTEFDFENKEKSTTLILNGSANKTGGGGGEEGNVWPLKS